MIEFDEQPLGEHPDVTIARCVSEIDELRAENTDLRKQLAALQSNRDSIAGELSYFRRNGW